MPEDCLFCRIAAGTIPAYKVHEDDAAVAFLDIRPLARGHTLVIPRRHAVRFEDLDAESAARLWKAVHKVTPKLLRAVGAPSTTIAINNGREAGQEVPHVHVHIVPRTGDDGRGPIHALFQPTPAPSQDELRALADRVRNAPETRGATALS
jgi:histidine triad (HIT) family protein